MSAVPGAGLALLCTDSKQTNDTTKQTNDTTWGTKKADTSQNTIMLDLRETALWVIKRLIRTKAIIPAHHLSFQI